MNFTKSIMKIIISDERNSNAAHLGFLIVGLLGLAMKKLLCLRDI